MFIVASGHDICEVIERQFIVTKGHNILKFRVNLVTQNISNLQLSLPVVVDFGYKIVLPFPTANSLYESLKMDVGFKL